MFHHLYITAIPWMPFVLFAMGLILCMAIFQLLSKDTQALRNHIRDKESARDILIASMQAEIENLKQELREAEQRTGVLVQPTPARSGFNLSKRSQALRMSRLGENAENI